MEKLKFTQITNKNYIKDSKVYDLSVEEDCSYNINDLIVHNSANGSFVAYVLGITRIDPIKWNLPFERFLSTNKFNPKIIIENENGDVLEFVDEELVEVERDGNIIQIKAGEFKDCDIFIKRCQ